MKKTILGIIFASLVLTGCSDHPKVNDNQSSELPTYFVAISDEYCHEIVYDTRTGVEYSRSGGSYNGGTLTLLVDADGNPLIYKGEK